MTGYLECDELLAEGSNLTFYLSMASTIGNVISYCVLKIFRVWATQENFVMISVEGMTANMSWLPHQDRMKKN